MLVTNKQEGLFTPSLRYADRWIQRLSNDGFHTKRRKQNIENAVIDAKCARVHFPHYRNTQGGHILAKMKFPVFSLSFPCVTKIFPVLFLRKN